MKATLAYPSYYDIQKGCAKLAKQILADVQINRPTQMVVALSRGGLIPGVELSHILELPLTPVCYSAKSGHGDNRNHLNNLPDLVTTEQNTVILVDDISDSGRTLNEVQAYYARKYIVKTAVLYWKTGSEHTPTYYWQRIEADAPWIIFPWEA